MDKNLTRRGFIHKSVVAGIGLTAINPFSSIAASARPRMKFGLVTYQWGKDWDLPTLISNCEKVGFKGVELRTQHAHGVEINLSPAQRAEVRKRFNDSSVTCVGYGSNYEYHSPDPKILRTNIEDTKEYIKLCKDIGAPGIKVKPNTFPKDVPREKTIAQIATSLNEIGKYAKDYDQLVRVEIHGRITQEIPNIRAIFEQVTEPNVKMCWNSNDVDLNPPGLEANFKSVAKWIGDTVHIRGIKISDYPYDQLFRLLNGIKYRGWILVEASTQPPDKIAAMKEQVALFNEMMTSLK